MTQKRLRVTLDTTDRHRRAFNLFAAARGLSAPEAFAAVVEEYMGDFLTIADRQIAAEKSPADAPRPRKPRG